MGIYSIPIMSIHKSKGLEFESVILLGLEDRAFWNYEDSQKMKHLHFSLQCLEQKLE
ncbi:hypothetical protein KQR56_01120 [Bacillus velezensis]|nr:hypothetical protein [Bacillus velezensis]